MSANNRRQTSKLPVSHPQLSVIEIETFLIIEPHRFLKVTSWDVVEWVIPGLIWPLLASFQRTNQVAELNWDALKVYTTEIFPVWHDTVLVFFCLFVFNHRLLNWYILCCVPLEFYLFLRFFYQVSIYFHHCQRPLNCLWSYSHTQIILSETSSNGLYVSMFLPTFYSLLFMYCLKRLKLSLQLFSFLSESTPESPLAFIFLACTSKLCPLPHSKATSMFLGICYRSTSLLLPVSV